MMSLLIPWTQIIALGAIEESSGVKPGFAAVSVDGVPDPPPHLRPRGPAGDPV
jgi:hypothetical protein